MTPRLMRVSSKMLFLAVTTAGFNLPAEPLPDTAASTNLISHAMMVKAEVRHEGGPGLMLADRAYLAAGTNRFAFLIPPELRLQVVEQRRVQLFTADYSLLLTVQVLDRPSPGTPQLDVNVSREHILKEYPGAKILSQSAPTVCGREGLGFEFEWIADGNLARRSRVCPARIQHPAADAGGQRARRQAERGADFRHALTREQAATGKAPRGAGGDSIDRSRQRQLALIGPVKE
jgi:hypothetical protein